jgi:ERCC4-related helicase
MPLSPGDLVRVRSRQYLVEEVTPPPRPEDSPLVRLSCLEDDALGEPLQVLWDHEVDAHVFGASSWRAVAERGFDEPRKFSAFLHTLRWNCVTSTDPKLFQAPYRAGIDVKAYQLEPLRKALLMPRVNLFIADDVGLGKTIEAGLILRELLLRQKIRRVVVACPPSVVPQWREEMEQRFGLSFVVLDRDYVTARRQERGFGVNAWTTHSRFIISHALLRDETYAAPLRDWLTSERAPSLLILDEAHNVAPAQGSRYAIDSKLTKVARDLAPLFEHKLFLSATPHNGHSNSFSALLEILDPQRFCRGVPVQPEARDAVMVRRLKKDLKEIDGDDFPDRDVDPIVISGLSEDAPELALSRLLQQYRNAREARLADQSRSQRSAAMLVITSLQKRLLSSIEAFARTLAVHRRALESARPAPAPQVGAPTAQQALLLEAPGADDVLAELDEKEVETEDDAQVAAASPYGKASSAEERALLDEMSHVAEQARHEPDSRLQHLIEWLRTNMVPDLGRPEAPWLPRRVLIFTEYADTKRWLHQQLLAAIEGSDRYEERIATFHGGMGEESREAVKAAFNADPEQHPLRILIATDAAREGVNLQNHCADLFHFDVPWNPSRMEQRNGRIDRKLQRAKRVTCRYFVLPQRAEDRVLEVLVEKTKLIHEQLGSLPPVVERSLSKLLSEGIRHEQEDSIKGAIARADEAVAAGPSTQVITEELEAVRERRGELAKQVSQLEHLLAQSRQHLQLDGGHFRSAISVALQLVGAHALEPVDVVAALRDPEGALWHVPALDEDLGKDPTWAATLDALRPPMKKGERLDQWRRTSRLRPFVFKDPRTLDGSSVHLHLEHRVVQRLLGRFLAQGFLRDDLSRACVLLTEDPIPRLVALGRLSLYGDRAARLHDEIIGVAAEWKPVEARGRAKLRPLGEDEKHEVLRLVETSLATPSLHEVPKAVRERFRQSALRDIEELVPHLEKRAQAVRDRALRKLAERGEKEGEALGALLKTQRKRIRAEQEKMEDPQLALPLDKDEQRQLEANRRHWRKRLDELSDSAIEREAVAVHTSYRVRAHRVEPAGVVYLWPVSG